MRHGEAEHNVAFYTEGDAAFSNEKYRDAPLTEKGKQQAHDLGVALSPLNILDIWSSPLTRCIQTTQELYEEINCNGLYLHDTLLERQGGRHVCNIRKSKQELQTSFPIFNSSLIPEYGPLWVEHESNHVVSQRMIMFLLYLQEVYKNISETEKEKEKEKEKDIYICIVSHNNAIQCVTGKSLANAEHLILTLKEILSQA